MDDAADFYVLLIFRVLCFICFLLVFIQPFIVLHSIFQHVNSVLGIFSLFHFSRGGDIVCHIKRTLLYFSVKGCGCAPVNDLLTSAGFQILMFLYVSDNRYVFVLIKLTVLTEVFSVLRGSLQSLKLLDFSCLKIQIICGITS